MRCGHNKWSILVYVIILANLSVVIAWILFTKSEIIFDNMEYQKLAMRSSRNIEEKWVIAMSYDKAVNSDGRVPPDNWYTPAIYCPTASTLTLSWATEKYTMANAMEYYIQPLSKTLYCSGYINDGVTDYNVLLSFNVWFDTFLKATVGANSADLTYDTISVSGALSFHGKPFIISMPYSNSKSEIDGNLNSDNYTSSSTGNIVYPGRYSDNDADARLTVMGYVNANTGWRNIFWNNSETNSYIGLNTNNLNDPYNNPVTGAGGDAVHLYFDIDKPFTMRILPLSASAYSTTRTFLLSGSIAEITGSGAIGWLQKGGTFAGSLTWSGGTHGSDPSLFNLRNWNYAIFLSYSNSLYTWSGSDYMRYKIRAETTSGTGIFISPINDTDENILKYLGNDVIIDSEGNYITKQQHAGSEMSMAKN